jgi:chromosomal replication initiation ATPase DnaA
MPKQTTLDFQHSNNYDKNNFLPSGCNQLAFDWINKFPNWNDQKISIVYGNKGCGKTHLGKIWQDKANALSVNKESNLEEVLQRLSIGENILIDDCDQIKDDKFLYNLYNTSKEVASGFILMTASSRPMDWGIELADAKSRIISLNAIVINEPDDFLLSGILVKLFADRQLIITPEVLNYLLLRMERSFSGAISLVEGIDKLSLEKKRNITIPLIKDLL